MTLDRTKATSVDGLPDILVSNFPDLGDTPVDYSGSGGQYVAVTAGADGLEFVAPPSPAGGDTWSSVIGATNLHKNEATGYVEFWGTVSCAAEATTTVTFSSLSGLGITSLVNANYNVTLTSTLGTDRQDNLAVSSRTSSSFNIFNSVNQTDTVMYRVTGFVSV